LKGANYLPVILKEQEYYRISDVCQITGVSKSTLWRWTKTGILEITAKRDRRGWRLFTLADIKKIKDEAHRVE
jgi:DNA-binding transcriptional MerR regulator